LQIQGVDHVDSRGLRLIRLILLIGTVEPDLLNRELREFGEALNFNVRLGRSYFSGTGPGTCGRPVYPNRRDAQRPRWDHVVIDALSCMQPSIWAKPDSGLCQIKDLQRWLVGARLRCRNDVVELYFEPASSFREQIVVDI